MDSENGDLDRARATYHVSKSAKTYPLLPDPDGQVGELVASILDKSARVEALEGALELECVALKRLHNCDAGRIPHGRRSGKKPS